MDYNYKKSWHLEPLFPSMFLEPLFPTPPPPHLTQTLIYGVTSGFTRLIMRTKYVCHSLISLHVNFNDNRTM